MIHRNKVARINSREAATSAGRQRSRRHSRCIHFLALGAVNVVAFGVGIACGFQAATLIVVGSFVTIVAIGQAYLFHGNRKRLASALVGSAALPAFVFALLGPPFDSGYSRFEFVAGNAIMAVWLGGFGAMAGYLAGLALRFIIFLLGTIPGTEDSERDRNRYS